MVQHSDSHTDRSSLRGFARMDPDKQREIARKGGANVPHDKRSFAQNRALASEAGRKGGRMSLRRRGEPQDGNGNGTQHG